jgi:hypothetical protein
MSNVKIKSFEGIAFYSPDECPDESHHEGCVVVVMVGDDHKWHVDASDVKGLEEDEFCGSCGQIGCGWG